VSAPLTAATRRSATVARDELALAIDRAAGARPIGGNRLEHHPDSPRALAVMLGAIATARQTIHLENYIIRDDATGRRFAAALAERARAGVRVRVLYDALGSFGTSRRYWRGLREAGAEVRAFHPLASLRLFELLARDHRKLLATDGTWAILGGLCIGDEWAGDPARKRRPWRDTMVAVSGPAVAALERAFARTWARAGAALPPDELIADPAPCGDSTVRIVEGVPQRARVYRTVQLLVASAAERLWITDAYLIAPAALYASLIDAAKAGVDVRLLVPGTTDLPVLRNFTRIGYRDMLHAGIRVFEYEGPMIHAKTMLVDHRWARVGSSNLNVSSLLTNYELDLAAECQGLTAELADQFRRDMRLSREIVLQARRRLLPPRLVDAPTTGADVPPDTSHKRSGYELGAVAVVALRRVAGGLRRGIAATAALGSATVGVLLLVFPRIMGIVFAAGAFALALTFTLYGFELRRTRDADDG
jgi:cardiolipin synthase